MSTQHTPGPWTFAGEGGHIVARNQDGTLRREASIAKVFPTWPIDEEVKANARLIAAAPDLLAALEVMLAIVEQEARDTKYDNAKQAARAVIAQAKGGAK